MPSVFLHGPYRFFFYAGDRDEPHHVHVERDDYIEGFLHISEIAEEKVNEILSDY